MRDVEEPGDAREVGRILSLFASAARVRCSRGAGHVEVTRLTKELRAALEPFVAKLEGLDLEISARSFSFRGRPIGEANAKSSLPALLHRDGVRALSFLPGVELADLEVVLSAVAQALAYKGMGDDAGSFLLQHAPARVKATIVDPTDVSAEEIGTALGELYGAGPKTAISSATVAKTLSALDNSSSGCHPARSLLLRPAYLAELTAELGGESERPSRPAAPAAHRLRRDSGTGRDPDDNGADRRVLAVEAHAKLFLAARELAARTAKEGEDPGSGSGAPRVHPIRVLNSILELSSGSAKDLLRLAATPARKPIAEACAVNTSLLSMLIGYSLGRSRVELLDLSLAALVHALALRGDAAEASRRPQLYARIVAVASAYMRAVSGIGAENAERLHPLEALRRLQDEAAGRAVPAGGEGERPDARVVDLLIMLLRAWPVGTRVILDSGEPAIVVQTSACWDRPEVNSISHVGRKIDLLARDGERYTDHVSGTALFHGVNAEARPPARAGEDDGVHPALEGDPAADGLTIVSGATAATKERADKHRPLLAREVISAKEAISRVRLPWLEQRRARTGAATQSADKVDETNEADGEDAPE